MEEITVEVPFNMPAEIEPESEYLLTVYACLKEDTLWADAGYEIALEQFAVECETETISADISSMPDVTVADSSTGLTVTGENFEIVFEKQKGSIDSFVYNGETIMDQGPVPAYSRGRTSNDLDWLALDNAQISSATSFDYEITDGGKSVTVNVELKVSAANCTQDVTYVIYGDGQVKVTSTLNLTDEVTELYRFGSVMTLPMDYENMTYYGRGDADTYVDRKRGSPAGIYSQSVSDSFFPYGNPQDTGNKTELRYIYVTSDEKDTGILITCDGLLEGSALHYTAKQLTDAGRIYELPEITQTYLSVDYGQRGTGGASCGPGPLTQYRLNNDGADYTYSYTIVPFDKNTDDVEELVKLWRDVADAE